MWEDGRPGVLVRYATGALSTALYALWPYSATADPAASYFPLLPDGNHQQEDTGTLAQSQHLAPRDSQDPWSNSSATVHHSPAKVPEATAGHLGRL